MLGLKCPNIQTCVHPKKLMDMFIESSQRLEEIQIWEDPKSLIQP